MGWWMASGEMVSRQTIKLEIGVDVVDDVLAELVVPVDEHTSAQLHSV